MFEAPQFESRVRIVAMNQAQQAGLPILSSTVASHLARIARANESVLLQREQEKEPSQRRGEKEALESVEQIVRAAARIANLETRGIIGVEQIDAAIKANWCRIWPFCK